jgi:hypothetical protein
MSLISEQYLYSELMKARADLAAERERCAKIVKNYQPSFPLLLHIASLIRNPETK